MAAVGLILPSAALRSADAAPAAPGRPLPAAAHHSAHLQRYDSHLLSHVNRARSTHNRHRFVISAKLQRVADRYAEHLAQTGRLQHNADLNAQVSRRCPDWTAVGENIAVVPGGSDASQMFRDYMHSPPHRHNILDGMYREVGIATVEIKHDGVVQRWNVMDFGNHC